VERRLGRADRESRPARASAGPARCGGLVGAYTAAVATRADAPLPVLHSLLHPTSLSALLADRFGAPLDTTRCRLLARGVADLYAVAIGAEQYVLRVLSVGHRTRAEIEYELDLIEHAGRRGVPIAAPMGDRDGSRILSLVAPEGERLAVLYRRARGVDRPDPYPDEAYGRAVALLHAALDDYRGRAVKRLDFDHLVNRCLRSLEPFLAHRPDDAFGWLERLAAGLRERLDEVAPGLEWGPCHGDCHGGNAMFARDGTITLIDYELCGHGWRAYDASVFLWSHLHRGGRTEENWAAYLRGYRSVRPLGEADVQAIDLFVPIRQLFWMGEWADHVDLWGLRHRMTDHFYDQQLAYLSRWVAEHPTCVAVDPGPWASDRLRRPVVPD
jgi:Ser/Thr protein kinase RdoA (MazF antagonist)